LNVRDIPLLKHVEKLAGEVLITGDSGRNWAAYGSDVDLASTVTPVQKALLTDPQTSGGLLAACAPADVDKVLEIFKREGFDRVAVIGSMQSGPARVAVA
jgi:selenide,water dikinase